MQRFCSLATRIILPHFPILYSVVKLVTGDWKVEKTNLYEDPIHDSTEMT